MFTKGIAKIGGRIKGTPNKLTGTFREAVLLAYENIGGHVAFSKWAAENRTDFYKIAARLIPTENKTLNNEGLTVIINLAGMADDSRNNTETTRSPTSIDTIDITRSRNTFGSI